MAKEQVNYRLVLDAGNIQTASEPAPLGKILAAFDEQVAKGVFRPNSGRRLLVVLDDEWASRRGPAARIPVGNQEAA